MGWVKTSVSALVVALTLTGQLLADGTLDEVAVLNERILKLHLSRKGGEAIPLARRALELREQYLPDDHPEIAVSLSNLASLYQAQGRWLRLTARWCVVGRRDRAMMGTRASSRASTTNPRTTSPAGDLTTSCSGFSS